MTGDFSREKIVGESEFASVYKCSLEDEKIVAVKQLKPGAIQGKSKFMALIDIMNRANHPNLNSLLGTALPKISRLWSLSLQKTVTSLTTYMVYLDCRGISDLKLRKELHTPYPTCIMNVWNSHPQIIHRDIKPANILLNSTFDAQVADFGFTKLEDKMRSHVTICSIKTIGYVAPEYGLGYKLTDKSDVYSFGIILIEILTSRTPELKIFDRYPRICEWAYAHIKSAIANDDISGLVDQKLKGEYNREEVYKMAKIILSCIELNPEDRPTMAEVLEKLEEEPDSYYSHGNASVL